MNQKCKFPFLTKISENETIEQTVCSLSMPPSHMECDMLQRAMNWTERVPREMNKIVIRKDISKDKNKNKNKNKSDRYQGVKSNYLNLDCYAESFFQNGWCGTCLESAKGSHLIRKDKKLMEISINWGKGGSRLVSFTHLFIQKCKEIFKDFSFFPFKWRREDKGTEWKYRFPLFFLF